jgi:hypothetical protein
MTIPPFVMPCIPTRAVKPPTGPDWVHERLAFPEWHTACMISGVLSDQPGTRQASAPVPGVRLELGPLSRCPSLLAAMTP